jgi:hypothetical protein
VATAPRHGNHGSAHRGGLRAGRQPPRLRGGNDVFLLWLALLGGPAAFIFNLVASDVLLSGSCSTTTGNGILFGLSSSQVVMAAITLLCVLNAAAAGVVSWHVWHRIKQPYEDRSGESLRAMPFWAMGGMFLSVICCLGSFLTGVLAITVSTSCA